MRVFTLVLLSTVWLTGCIVFDKKSTSVNFYQLSSPTATAQIEYPVVFIPRAQIPSSLRRPSLVFTENKSGLIVDDNARWVAPLDRSISESIARHITLNAHCPTTTQTPPGQHWVLLLDVSEFTLSDSSAILQMSYRLESEEGELIKQSYGKWESKSKNDPASLVKAQSINLANVAAEISQVILQSIPAPTQ